MRKETHQHNEFCFVPASGDCIRGPVRSRSGRWHVCVVDKSGSESLFFMTEASAKRYVKGWKRHAVRSEVGETPAQRADRILARQSPDPRYQRFGARASVTTIEFTDDEIRLIKKSRCISWRQNKLRRLVKTAGDIKRECQATVDRWNRGCSCDSSICVCSEDDLRNNIPSREWVMTDTNGALSAYGRAFLMPDDAPVELSIELPFDKPLREAEDRYWARTKRGFRFALRLWLKSRRLEPVMTKVSKEPDVEALITKRLAKMRKQYPLADITRAHAVRALIRKGAQK